MGVSEQFPARLLSKPISSTFFSPSSRGRLVVALAFRVLPVAGLQDDQQPEGPAQDDGARRRRHARAASRRPASTARRASAATRSAGPRRRRHCRTAAGPGRRRAAPRPRRTVSRRRASAACTPRSGASPSSAFAAAAPARLSTTTGTEKMKTPPLFDFTHCSRRLRCCSRRYDPTCARARRYVEPPGNEGRVLPEALWGQEASAAGPAGGLAGVSSPDVSFFDR